MRLPPLTAGCSLALPTPAVAALVLLALTVAGCTPGRVGSASSGATAPEAPTTTTAAPATTTAAPPPVDVVVAAGDIVCRPGEAVTRAECQMEATAALAESLQPDVVLPLGDLQYETGRLPDFQAAYEPTWGRLKSVTRPVVGNHEYAGGRAPGYYGYFGDAAHPPDGWYSFDLPSGWHVVVLNSVCAPVGGCGEGSRQLEWLQADLDGTASRCILAAFHNPRWSSGFHHSDDAYEPFWQRLAAHGADLVLGGHDHHYERFAPDDGIVQLVVGTGGRNLYPAPFTEHGTVVRQAHAFGVLELRLRPDGYDGAFRSIPGADFRDEFSAGC